MNALTKDGLVHRPAPGPSGATTACGRTELALTINEGWPVTCPVCEPKEVLLELESRLGPNPPQEPHRFVGYFDRNTGTTECRYCSTPEEEHP